MRIRFLRVFAIFAVTTMAAATLLIGSPALADANDNVTPSEVAAALDSTKSENDSLVAEPISSSVDTDSAAVITDGDTIIDVSNDPKDGVSLTSEDSSQVIVTVPDADTATDAKRLADGTIVYSGTEGSATAVIPTEGGMQMLTAIANNDASTRYTYGIDVPDGGKVELGSEGTALVRDASNNVLLIVPTPWATDANGVAVPTYFETDGTSLTQIIEHTSENYTYPVLADPWFSQVINMLLGCFGLKDLARMGLARTAWIGGRQVIVRLIPWIGWVSCGIGAYAGWNG